MIKKEPRMEISDGIAALFIYLGLLMFLILIHLFTINSIGANYETLLTLFKVYLNLYVGLLIFGVVALIIHLLRWLAWSITTPEWSKKKSRGQ